MQGGVRFENPNSQIVWIRRRFQCDGDGNNWPFSLHSLEDLFWLLVKKIQPLNSVSVKWTKKKNMKIRSRWKNGISTALMVMRQRGTKICWSQAEGRAQKISRGPTETQWRRQNPRGGQSSESPTKTEGRNQNQRSGIKGKTGKVNENVRGKKPKENVMF